MSLVKVIMLVVLFSSEGLTASSEPVMSFDGTRKLNSYEAELTNWFPKRSYTKSCISQCPKSYVNCADCDSIHNPDIKKMTGLLESFHKCLAETFCGNDFADINLKNLNLSMTVNGYPGLCYLLGPNVNITGANKISDTVKLPYPGISTYEDLVRAGPMTIDGLSVYCTPICQPINKNDVFSGTVKADLTLDQKMTIENHKDGAVVGPESYDFRLTITLPSSVPAKYQQDLKKSIYDVLLSRDATLQWTFIYVYLYYAMYEDYVEQNCNSNCK